MRDAKWGKRRGALKAWPYPASLQCLEKGPEIFLVLKKATNQSLCKCNSRRESGSIQQGQLNLAALVMWSGLVMKDPGEKGWWDLPL